MPLFMDFHKMEHATVEEVKKTCLADIEVQELYGVRYRQFWINPQSGTFFCLIEGPDAATCDMVHRMKNNDCNLIEVEAGFYERMKIFDHTANNYRLVKKKDGSIDTGCKTLLAVCVFEDPKARTSGNHSFYPALVGAQKIIPELIDIYGGDYLTRNYGDFRLAVFDDTADAVSCALSIKNELNLNMQALPELIFKIGISTTLSDFKDDDPFKDSVNMAYNLSLYAVNNQILACSLVRKICKKQDLFADNAIKTLHPKEEAFLMLLSKLTESKIYDKKFDLNKISHEICISRPQLYRKIMALTGRSPNHLIIDLRMQKAISLLKQKGMGIAEIAYESGFNSASYFTKCFFQKFGYRPSELLRNNTS